MAAQKKAYEELVVAYKSKMKQVEEKTDEVNKLRKELERVKGRVKPVVEEMVEKEPGEEIAALREKINALNAENESLHHELKLV